MTDIKVKQGKKGTIKTLNKAIIGTERIKDNLINVKEKTQEAYQDESNVSGTDYAINKIGRTASNAPSNFNIMNKYGKKYIDITKTNVKEINAKIKIAKRRNNAKKVAQKIIKNSKNTAKTTIKTADRVAKATKETAKTSTKIMQKAIQSAKETARVTIQTTKVAIKATVTAIKTAVTGTKALISAILAGRLDSSSYHNDNCNNWRFYLNCF